MINLILFRKAVLIIHGFSGGTYDQELLCFELERHNKLDVYNFTLPGHDKRTLKSVKYNEWIEAAEEKIKLLIKYGYKDIYLVGHSMGGVIATYLSTKYKKIKKLVLVSPAFSYFTPTIDSKVTEKIKGGVKALKEYDSSEIVNKFLKLPVSSLNQFVDLVEMHKECYNDINVPVLILHGKDDCIVPVESSKDIYKKIKVNNKKLVLLDQTTHEVFRTNNLIALREVRDFLLNKY